MKYHHARHWEMNLIWWYMKKTNMIEHEYLCWCGCHNLYEWIISYISGKEYTMKNNPMRIDYERS